MRILAAEDETDLAMALKALLEHNGYSVDVAADGLEAVELCQSKVYDMIILDIMMPRLDGIAAVTQIREMGVTSPVLFLTAKSEIDDRISGLDAGADDYLTKPFAMGELLARIRSMTRRNTEYTPSSLGLGNVTLDIDKESLIGVNTIGLSAVEVRLMELLMRNPGRDLSTSEIFEKLWKEEEGAEPALVWVYISFLKNKLFSIGADICIKGEEGGIFSLVKE